MRYDVVVVGARCAGAATAMLLARSGLRVLAVERGRYGSDTLSTHALMRGGVLQLARWGLLDAVRASGAPAVRTTSFHYGDESVTLPIRERDGVDGLYSPRRRVLDKLLVDHALAAGAEAWFGFRLVNLIRSSEGRVRGVVVEDSTGIRTRVECGLVIGADGVRSTVAQIVGAEVYQSSENASGVVYGYWSGLEVEGNQWYFQTGSGAGAIPTNDGETLVFTSMPRERFLRTTRHDLEADHDALLADCAPGLLEAMGDARRTSPLRGFAGVPGYFRECYGPGWALVGDAGYFKDPITAHGMTDAFRDAELVTRAAVSGSRYAFAEYRAVRDALSTELFRITDRVASYEWSLDEVKDLHVRMSAEMNQEIEALLALDRVEETGGALAS